MPELFLIGSVGFWILIAVEFIVLLAVTEHEKPGWGLVSIISLALLLRYLGNYSVLNEVLEHPKEALAFVFGYFVMGTLWAVLKWFLFVRVKRDQFLAAKEEYAKSPERDYGHEKGTPILIEWEQSRVRANLLNHKGKPAPLAREHKAQILHWMAYWPWSALWTVIHDAVTKTYKVI